MDVCECLLALRLLVFALFVCFLGQVDVQMLTMLQSTNPGVPITADIVEGSSELSDNFRGKWKLEDIPFCSSAIVDFEKAKKS